MRGSGQRGRMLWVLLREADGTVLGDVNGDRLYLKRGQSETWMRVNILREGSSAKHGF